MTTVIPSQCEACVRLHASGWQCDAFPVEIPKVMLVRLGDHRRPLPGDHGLQFEQQAGVAAAEAFDLWARVAEVD